jgi:molybdenum cofactor biosynthesis protein B
MVDFQSRDTTRGLSDDEDDEDENEDAERAAEADDGANTDAHGSGTDDSPAETHSTVDAASTDDPLSATTPSGEQGEKTHDGHDHAHAHDHGPDVGQLGVAVMTVSSSRTRDDDSSGDAIVEYVGDTDHEVVTRDLVVDDLDGVQRSVLALTGRDDVDAVVTTGGTGVTPDDVTVEAIEPLFDKHLPGFGELFRVLSFEEVGTRAMSSRTTAGISEGVPVFCLPGSENAVRLGMEELVLAELEHLVGLATRE